MTIKLAHNLRGNADAKKRRSRTLFHILAGVVLSYILAGYLMQRLLGPSSLDPDGIAAISRNLCLRGEFSITPGTPSVYRAPAYPAALALPCMITGRDPLNFLPLLNGVCQWMTLLLLCRHPLAPTGKARLAVVLAVGLDPLLLNFSGRAYVEPSQSRSGDFGSMLSPARRPRCELLRAEYPDRSL